MRTAHGAKYWIDFYPEIIEELDTMIRECGIELGWKTTGLRDRVALTGQPWAWVDDDAIDMARSFGSFDADRDIGQRGLLMPTNPATRITREQIAEIRAFAVNGGR